MKFRFLQKLCSYSCISSIYISSFHTSWMSTDISNWDPIAWHLISKVLVMYGKHWSQFFIVLLLKLCALYGTCTFITHIFSVECYWLHQKKFMMNFFVPTLLNFTLILFERLSAVKILCCHICDLKGNMKSLKNCINVMLNVKKKNKTKVISSSKL